MDLSQRILLKKTQKGEKTMIYEYQCLDQNVYTHRAQSSLSNGVHYLKKFKNTMEAQDFALSKINERLQEGYKYYNTEGKQKQFPFEKTHQKIWQNKMKFINMLESRKPKEPRIIRVNTLKRRLNKYPLNSFQKLNIDNKTKKRKVAPTKDSRKKRKIDVQEPVSPIIECQRMEEEIPEIFTFAPQIEEEEIVMVDLNLPTPISPLPLDSPQCQSFDGSSQGDFEPFYGNDDLDDSLSQEEHEIKVSLQDTHSLQEEINSQKFDLEKVATGMMEMKASIVSEAALLDSKYKQIQMEIEEKCRKVEMKEKQLCTGLLELEFDQEMLKNSRAELEVKRCELMEKENEINQSLQMINKRHQELLEFEKSLKSNEASLKEEYSKIAIIQQELNERQLDYREKNEKLKEIQKLLQEEKSKIELKEANVQDLELKLIKERDERIEKDHQKRILLVETIRRILLED